MFYKKVSILLCLSCLFPATAVADRNNEASIISEKAVDSLFLDALSTDEQVIFVGERGHILYRSIGDSNWAQANVPLRVNLTSISAGPNNLWAVGHDGTVLKAMSPEKWLRAIEVEYLFDVAEKKLKHVLKDPELDDYFRDTLMFTQEQIETGKKSGAGNSLFDIQIARDGNGVIVGASGWAFLTRDYGETWEFIMPELNNIDGFHLYSVAATANGTWFIVGEAAQIFRSTDTKNWEMLNIPYDGTLLSVNSTDIPGEIYVLAMGGKIFHSIDNGNNWKLIQLPSSTILQGFCKTKNNEVIVVGLGGNVFRIYQDSISRIIFPGRQNLAAAACADDRIEAAGEGGIYPLELNHIATN